MDAYQNGKDMYATLGAGVYKCDYWDCMEHHQDGTKNEEGAKRRKKMKTLLLAMLYGMGPGTLAARLNCTTDEARQIIEDFYTGFPIAKKWMSETEANAEINGFVEDFWGRRRRLPDLQLPKIEVKYSKFNKKEFNPLLGANNKYIDNNTDEINYYKQKASACKYRNDLEKLKAEAEQKGIYIKDNGSFISTAKRQCVNARIQGGAATMTKKAMINIFNDEEMHRLGFKLLIGVHDELIGECPKENAEKVAERLSYLMRTAVPELNVPFKCDAEIEDHWYKNEYNALIKYEYEDHLKQGKTESEAFKLVCENHEESLEEALLEAIKSNV